MQRLYCTALTGVQQSWHYRRAGRILPSIRQRAGLTPLSENKQTTPRRGYPNYRLSQPRPTTNVAVLKAL